MSKSKLWPILKNFNFWKKKFPELKISGIVPSNIIYHFWEFEKYLGSKRFFSKILSVEKSTNQFFYKHYNFFFEKRALSLFLEYWSLINCQVSEKSLERLLRSGDDIPSRAFCRFQSIAQLEVENSYMYSRAVILRTKSFIDMRFSQDGSWHFCLSFSNDIIMHNYS